MRWVLVAAGALKATQGFLVGEGSVALGFVACAVLVACRLRLGAGVLGVFAAVVVFDDGLVAGNDGCLLALVALAVALFDGRDREMVLWVQAVVVYAFAGLNKANPGWLDGSILENREVWLPGPAPLLAALALAVELWLAVAVWRRWRSALPVAVGLHLGIVATWSLEWSHVAALTMFNGMMVVLVARAVRSGPVDDDDDADGAASAVATVGPAATAATCAGSGVRPGSVAATRTTAAGPTAP